MKKILFLLLSISTFAQSPTCGTVAPMCGDGGLTFQNTTNGANNNLGVGCLVDSPNQAWFFMKVGTSGPMNFQISQVSNTGGQIDVDFICWGPFPENIVPNTLCTQLFDFPNGNNANGDNIIACSYSPNAVENFSISNAIQGQIYILLITNFSGQAGTISLSQTNINAPNAGTTSCNVVCNVDLGPDQSICNGNPVTLSANLTANTTVPGTPTYQWFKDGVLLANVASTLTVSQSGLYQVVVSRPGCTANPPPSDTITVNFGGQALLNTNPPNLICSNDETYNLNSISTIVLNGNAGNLVFYNSLSNAQSQTNPITNTSNFIGTNGQQLCAKVNVTGDACPYYACFTLSCTPPICPTITNPTGVQSVCLSSNPLPVAVSVTNATSIKFVYFDTPQTGTAMYSGGNLLGFVNPSFGIASYDAGILGTLNSLPNILGTYYIYAIPNPTPQFITCRPFQEIIVTVINPPIPAVISGNAIQCVGNPSTFTSNTLLGTWSSSNNSIITINPLTGIATGVASGNAKIRFSTLATPTCNSVVSEFDVFVNPIPPGPVPVILAPLVYCENAIVPPLQAIGNQLKWYTSATGGTALNSITPNTTLIGITQYYVTQTLLGCESARVPVSVTVNANPIVTFVNNAPTICSGASTQITLSSSVNNVTYFWDVISGIQSGATSGSGSQFNNLVLTNNTLIPIEVIYIVRSEANNCSVGTTEIKVIVNPTPNVTLNPTNDFEICSGEKIDIKLTSTVSNTVFNYSVLNVLGVTGYTQGIGTSISDTLINSGTTTGTITYLVTPAYGNCFGTSKQITVTVKPKPVAIPQNINFPNYPIICSGNAPNIIINSLDPNTSFIFTVEQDSNVSGAFDGNTFANINGSLFLDFQVLINNSNQIGSVEYTIKPLLNGCFGDPIKLKIFVNPLPKPILQNGVICVDELGIPLSNFTINSGLSSFDHTFVWKYINNSGLETTLPFTTSSISVNQVGSYNVVATNTITGCTSFPSNPAIITSSIAATQFVINQSVSFADLPFIEVIVLNGTGTYLYQINDSEWQTSNIFENVNFGNYIVRIKDTLGCTNLSDQVKIITHMKFFTPNADGYQDTWKLFGLENQQDASISIYNKYGKLLKQLSTIETSNGWDGTYLGNNLPSDDYWFVINYKENGKEKTFKSHFTLKR
jgi:gliding motility-associated-like protein